MNMPIDAFLTALYVIVDDWYQLHGPRLLAGKAGSKPTFSDSEVMTLSIAQHWCGFATEREWLRFVRNNHPDLFPKLVSQSEFNVRARSLCWVIRELGNWAIEQMEVRSERWRLVDGTPIHARHWRRYGPRSLALPGAALGRCAAKREGALDLLEAYSNLCTLGDKGFLDQMRQAYLQEQHGIHLLTPKRKNQKQQNPKEWDLLLKQARQRIESVYSQAKAFFGLEKPGAKTFWGLASRLIAKLTGMALAAWANRSHGRSPLVLAEFAF